MTDGRLAARGAPNPIDVHVGSRLRLRRTLLGMSQEKLAEAIGLTFQQVQKYERGVNRIGSSRLYDLGRALDVPVSYFFEDMPPPPAPRGQPGGRENPLREHEVDQPEIGGDRQSMELLRAYRSITDPQMRRRILQLAKTMARTQKDV